MLMALVAPLAPAARAQADAPQGADATQGALVSLGTTDAGELLIDAALHPDDARATTLAIASNLERSGQLPYGATDQLAATRGMPAAPPSNVYRDARVACDIDHDGVPDLISDDLTLSRPPSLGRAASTITALSGADGHVLWTRDNDVLVAPPTAGQVSFRDRGDAFPGMPTSVSMTGDVNGDGVCDVLSFNVTQTERYNVPPFGPSYSEFTTNVHLISGKDGSDLWTRTFEGRDEQFSEPFFGNQQDGAPLEEQVTLGFPTAAYPFLSPAGPQIVLKTTDIVYAHAYDTLHLTTINALSGGRRLFNEPVHYEDVRISEHVMLLDATTGKTHWQHDLSSGDDGRYTNLTWVSGAADVAGDAQPEVILDQLFIGNPRTNSVDNPMSPGNQAAERPGKGMRMLALKGELEGKGDVLWSTLIADAIPVKANLPIEEESEQLQWTRGLVLGDMDGDGKADPMATYVAREEALSQGDAAIRTHFVALHGANGTKMWDAREQGWGTARTLAVGPSAPLLVGLGLVDMPAQIAGGLSGPPKAVRLVVLDARTGANVWTDQKLFGSASPLSYNLALGQYETALAPHDWNGDGVLDLVTPAQYEPPTGRDQVLLSTASHTYDIRSGLDGHVLRSVTAWGPTGRVVACAGSDDLFVLSGHSRRVDLTRFDVANGTATYRRTIYANPAPRAATSSIDMLGLGVECGATGPNTFFGANLQLFSFDRRYEVIPVMSTLSLSGQTDWQQPPLAVPQPSEAILRASLHEAPSTTPVWIKLAGGAAAGLVAGALLVVAIVRLPRLRSFAGLGALLVVLLLIAPNVGALALVAPPSGPATEASPALAHAQTLVPPAIVAPSPSSPPPPSPSVGHDPATVRFVAAARAALASNGADLPENMTPGYDRNDSISYTYPLPDIDHDGTSDFAVDQYCTDFSGCRPLTDITTDTTQLLLEYPCGPRHMLYGVGGANGTPEWVLDLSMGTLYSSCGFAFVVGEVPLANTTGLLVYKYVAHEAFFSDERVVDHEIDMVDGATGRILWAHTERGALATDLTEGTTAQDAILQPILQRSANGTAAIFVQQVSFRYTGASTFTGVPLVIGREDVLDSYQPTESAERLDIESGAVVWQAPTFQPDPQRSVWPRLVDVGYADSFGLPAAIPDRYWNGVPCCFDANGDGVPDLVYRTLEWNPYPNARVQGPYDYDARLVVFDGATGKKLGERWLDRDIQAVAASRRPAEWSVLLSGGSSLPGYAVRLQGLGDKLLVTTSSMEPQLRHNVTVLAGADLKPLWAMPGTRMTESLPLGGDKIATFAWYGFVMSNPLDTRDQRDLLQPLDVVVRDATTGRELWRASSYGAASDLRLAFETIARTGLPDLDHDGVADVPLDDPRYLDTETVIHETTWYSGATGKKLISMETVGAFAVPAGMGDLTGDGVPDVAILGGDVNDLWATAYSGADGHALWSRRVLALATSSYAEALPKLKILPIQHAGSAKQDVLIDAHVDVTNVAAYLDIILDGGDQSVQSVLSFVTRTQPQVLRVSGETGGAVWALPKLDRTLSGAEVPGASPGERAFESVLAQARANAATEAVAAVPSALPVVGGFVLAAALVVATSLVVLRARSRDAEVPDLD